MTISTPDIWIAFGLNTETKQVVIAGFAHSPDDAEAKAITRRNNGECSYHRRMTAMFCDKLGDNLERWLSRFMRKRERAEVIRQIGIELLKMVEEANA